MIDYEIGFYWHSSIMIPIMFLDEKIGFSGLSRLDIADTGPTVAGPLTTKRNLG